jgi:hypothetical protein
MTNGRLRRAWLCALAVCVVGAAAARGQGGPPMITDDPGTPGDKHWENNIAIAFEHRAHEWSLETPAIDLNYGWGDHIQLTLQTSVALLKRSDHGVIGGLGGTEAALKWRFLDEDQNGVDMSMFPRVLFNVLQSSVRRGLAEDGTRFQLPFQVAKKFGRFDLDFEYGALASTVGRSEWLYGVVAGCELSKTAGIMAELQGTARTNYTQDVLTANVGWRYQFNQHATWIASIGHELRAPQQRALIGYCGVQFTY